LQDEFFDLLGGSNGFFCIRFADGFKGKIARIAAFGDISI